MRHYICSVILLLYGVSAFAAPKSSSSAFGVVTIDVQKTFFNEAANPNISNIQQNIVSIFQMSQNLGLPFFITYEYSESGDHDIPAALKSALPANKKDFIKTTYQATSNPAFASALQSSGLKNLLLLGSETDVCVLQTALGLKQMGFRVWLVTDAVFSSEPNVTPALQRMTDAGIELTTLAGIPQLMQNPPAPPTTVDPGSLVQPFTPNGDANVALVLNFLDDASLQSATDTYATQKLARLRELLLLSDWLEVPTYIIGTNADNFQIPQALQQLLGKKALQALNDKKWLPFSQFPAGQFSQVFVAGTAQNIGTALSSLGSRQILLVEDGLIGSATIDPSTVIPFTYKMVFYDMTKSIDPSAWPPLWNQRDATFYPVMKAPESLPPIGAAK